MDPQDLHKVADIFHAALDLAPESRAAFLATACAGDAELLHEVESLLVAHDRAGEFIKDSAADVAAEWLDGGRHIVGRFVDKYRVLSPLGSGGMGEIYLAEDTRLGRKVALKFLPASFAGDEERVRRFRREAKAASALNHPNILTVYEIGRWRGIDFIATEYIEGVTLRTRMRGKPISIGASIDIALRIAGALKAAHGAGIVHRDIKPENVMVRPDGLVKVLDFGIAKHVEPVGHDGSTTIETVQGVVVGTTAYMSPEQARGLEVDQRSDVWSLGVVLFELVAGELPFPGDTPSDRVAAILERDPEPLGRSRRDVPAELERIVRRALAKNLDERYAHVAEMADDLRKLRPMVGDEPFLGARPPTRSLSLARRHPVITFTLLVLVVATVIGFGLSRLRSGMGAPTIESLAVLPLDNGAGSSDTEYLSDGVTEDLINNLAKLPALKVMSRNSVFPYKGREVDATTVGSALRVQAVLTGRVVQHDDNVSISFELVDARDGRHLWGEQYSRPLTDLPALQAEVTRDVSRTLRSRITGANEAQLAKDSAANPDAYRNYLKGRYFVLKATRPEIERGISYFRQAIDIDPSYARAYVGLADAYRVLAIAGETPATEELPKAKAAATKAVAIDESLAEGHAILGFVIFWYDWNWSEAEKELRRALELDPNNADAHEAYAHVLSYTGRHAEGLAEIGRAVDLDPLSARTAALEGAFLINAGRAEEASARLQKALALEPNYWFTRQYAASAYIERGMFDEAIGEARRAQQLSGVSTRPTAFLGYALAQSGRPAEARLELEKLLKLSTERYVSPYNIAMMYVGLGQRDDALRWLERGYREREPRMVFLKSEPKWNSLRSDPRFRDLLRRIGFTS
jgi:serine/threonine protein kinase/tetratricopeptide (TPR) repeat protein